MSRVKLGKILQVLVPAVLILAVAVLALALVAPRVLNSTTTTRSMSAGSGIQETSIPPVGPSNASGMETSILEQPSVPPDALITSSGGVIAGSPENTHPAQVEGNLGQKVPQLNEGSIVNQPADWEFYADKKFGFSLTYPGSYVILDQVDSHTAAPNLVHQVRFQDKAVVTSDVGNVSPPAFSIQIFENTSGTPLAQWIDKHDSRQGSTRTAVTIGDLPGIKVELNTYIAPGQFYYVAHGKYLYKLTPVGQSGEQMLKSFKVTQP